MRDYRREVLQKIDWTENTGLSAELLIRPLMRDYDVRERPIEYDERKRDETRPVLRRRRHRNVYRAGCARRTLPLTDRASRRDPVTGRSVAAVATLPPG